MDFNWAEYTSKLFDNNLGLNPNSLWDLAVADLSDGEKVAAFNQGAAKSDLAGRFQGWLNTKTSDSPISTVTGVHSYDLPVVIGGTSGVHAGGAIPSEYGELKMVRNTHNTSRKDKWVVFGEWTPEDILAAEEYNYSMKDAYLNNAQWCNKAYNIMHDDGSSHLRDSYKKILDTAGACPIV